MQQTTGQLLTDYDNLPEAAPFYFLKQTGKSAGEEKPYVNGIRNPDQLLQLVCCQDIVHADAFGESRGNMLCLKGRVADSHSPP